MDYTLKNFMNKGFMIEGNEEAYLQIMNYLFKTNASLDKNLIFYYQPKDEVVAVDVEDDFLETIEWEDFYVKNEKEINRILKPSLQEFKWGAAAVKINNEEDLKLFKNKYDIDFEPKNFMYNIFYYYNREDEKINYVIDEFYGPVVNLKDIL